MSNFIVYILKSISHDKYYIGQTNDMNQRIRRHNTGQSVYTKQFIPWEVVLTLEKSTRSEAMSLEKKLKNLNRDRLEQFIRKYSKE